MLKSISKNYQLVIVCLITSLIYSNTLFNDYALDDKAAVYENTVTKEGLNGIKDIFTHYYYYGGLSSNTHTYRPIPGLTHAIEWQLFQRNPSISHFINILLYIISIIVLFKLLTFLFEKQFPGSFIPFIASLLFALHPVHTEVVANIKGRDEMLSLLFILSGIYYYMLNLAKANLKIFVVTGLFFFLALLSKESGILFMLFLPLIIYFFSQNSFSKSIIQTLPFTTIVIIYALIVYNVLGRDQIKDQFIFNVPYLYATPSEAFATKFFVISKYLMLLLYPHPLICDYTYNHIPYIGLQDYRFWFSSIFIISLLALSLFLFKRKNIFSFCILFFLAGISLVSNFFIQTLVILAERSLYTGSISFCIAIAVSCHIWLSKSPAETKKIKLALTTFLLLSVSGLYAMKVISRNKDWKNDFHLFTHDAEDAKDGVKLLQLAGYFNYFGNPKFPPGVLPDTATRNDCIQKLKKSITLLPKTFPEPYVYLSYIYLSFDSIDLAYINIDQARKQNMQTQQMIDLLNEISKKYEAKGDTSYLKKDLEQASMFFKKAILANENNMRALWNYGGICLEKGNKKDAVANWEKVVALDPAYPNAKEFLNVIKAQADSTAR